MKWEDLYDYKIKLAHADIGFSRNKHSVISKRIRFWEQRVAESKSLTEHVFGISGARLNIGLMCYKIIEALFDKGVIENSLYKYDTKDYEIIIFRNKNLSEIQGRSIVQYVKKTYLGKMYSLSRILLQLLDRAISKFLPFEFNFFAKFGPKFSAICSLTWAVPYSKQDIFFGGDPRSMDPDQMLDYCLAHPDEWQIVFVTDDFFRKE